MPPVFPLADPLEFPLRGAQVIEASAGTGKTWTLAALYVRLVLGHGHADGIGLLPPQILVMTFTEAATAELRGRIRERLVEAAGAFRQAVDAPAADAFLEGLRAAYPVGQWPRCALQLELAGQWMDEASIHTIHGWSHRMLRQHAFESASLFRQEKVEDPAALRLEAARDYWRSEVYPLDMARLRALEAAANSPGKLLEHIEPLRRLRERDPEATVPAVPTSLREALEPLQAWNARRTAADAAARSAWRAHRADLEVQLRAAMAEALDGRSFRADRRESFLERMARWCEEAPGRGQLRLEDLRRFSLGNLTRLTRDKCRTPEDRFGAFAALDELVAVLEAGAPVDQVLEHALQGVTRRYDELKAVRSAFDFPDLLQRLHHALHAPGGRLAAAIREQYPVALVDEFQDTDPWQYGALERIYLDDDAGSRGTLVMIGDPKQAIYGFRGADLDTYLRARTAADAVHTLTGNFRSTSGVVSALNHVFGTAPEPFGSLAYEPVTACRSGLAPLQASSGEALPALTVWHVAAAGALRRPDFRRLMAEGFATGIVELLREGVLQPAHVAILVADRVEAAAIRKALARRNVRSVYMSDRESVFASPEAGDLWRMLRAVSQPRLDRYVRAAIATRSFGYAPGELAHLLAQEPAMERQIERFVRWQAVWQRQGLLPMLYLMLHEQGIPARLLAHPDGERRLTNLLHLGDLLQRASVALQGEGALVRHFADRLRESTVGSDEDGGANEAQMRLETDAGLVKVVTMHKSKGLQYPVVFLPFAASFRNGSGDDSGARVMEDVRLRYVAFTRAERALFVGAATLGGEFPKAGGASRSGLGRLLGRRTGEDLLERLAGWGRCPDIRIESLPEATESGYAGEDGAAPAARRPADVPRRSHARAWGTHSFSSMTRHAAASTGPALTTSEADERFADSQVDAPRVVDAAVAVPPAQGAWDAYPRGARYGDLLHRLLEAEAREGWPVLRGDAGMAAWRARVEPQCDLLGLESAARELLPRWIAAIASCPLGAAGARLAELDATRAWPEMSFLIASRGATATAIDACIREHVLPGRVRQPLQPRALDGLLTGSLDLVFEAEGRWYVLDYKSNGLEGYDRAHLEEAVLAHRYDVQYALYVLALHRLLRSRLRDYDYDRHVGGALYFFVRGIGAAGAGLYVDRPPRALIEALDAEFADRRPARGEA